jgi:hypothetical protein
VAKLVDAPDLGSDASAWEFDSLLGYQINGRLVQWENIVSTRRRQWIVTTIDYHIMPVWRNWHTRLSQKQLHWGFDSLHGHQNYAGVAKSESADGSGLKSLNLGSSNLPTCTRIVDYGCTVT